MVNLFRLFLSLILQILNLLLKILNSLLIDLLSSYNNKRKVKIDPFFFQI